VSGTWANSTFFREEGVAAPKTPPPGFNGVLTRAQWKGVVDFSKAADARIVTSFATSPGTRGTTEQAILSREWLSQTDDVEAFYEELRDKYELGKPLWITETADAACGGNPWGIQFPG
jgi:hypothetical protein